jgi:hypothetical protein
MNRPTLLALLLLLPSLPTLRAQAPTAPAAAAPATADVLARYGTTYEAEFKKLTDKREADLVSLRQQYLGSLKKLEAAEQAAGNLAPLLAIREEIGRFEKENGVTEFNLRAEPESVASRQNLFLQRDGAIRLEFAKGLVSLTDKLVAALDKLQTDLTRQNQIDAALAARDFKDKTRARSEVAAAYNLVEIMRKAEEEEKAELTAAAQIAAAQPPAPVTPAAAEEEKPERGERGRDVARIRARFDEFVDAITEDKFPAAAEIVDPEQARKVGEFILNAYFAAFKPWFQIAKEHKIRIDPGKVRVSDDGKTAQNFPRFGKDEGKPTDWVKRDGEWYIVFKDKPKEDRPRRQK